MDQQGRTHPFFASSWDPLRINDVPDGGQFEYLLVVAYQLAGDPNT